MFCDMFKFMLYSQCRPSLGHLYAYPKLLDLLYDQLAHFDSDTNTVCVVYDLPMCVLIKYNV